VIVLIFETFAWLIPKFHRRHQNFLSLISLASKPVLPHRFITKGNPKHCNFSKPSIDSDRSYLFIKEDLIESKVNFKMMLGVIQLP
jgi:hypothetical protein